MTDPLQNWPTVRLRMRLVGEPVAVEAPMPPERVRLDEVLPLLRKIDDYAVGLAIQGTEALLPRFQLQQESQRSRQLRHAVYTSA
jgi:hypothetical protein